MLTTFRSHGPTQSLKSAPRQSTAGHEFQRRRKFVIESAQPLTGALECRPHVIANRVRDIHNTAADVAAEAFDPALNFWTNRLQIKLTECAGQLHPAQGDHTGPGWINTNFPGDVGIAHVIWGAQMGGSLEQTGGRFLVKPASMHAKPKPST